MGERQILLRGDYEIQQDEMSKLYFKHEECDEAARWLFRKLADCPNAREILNAVAEAQRRWPWLVKG
jgi:hypothetical protein